MVIHNASDNYLYYYNYCNYQNNLFIYIIILKLFLLKTRWTPCCGSLWLNGRHQILLIKKFLYIVLHILYRSEWHFCKIRLAHVLVAILSFPLKKHFKLHHEIHIYYKPVLLLRTEDVAVFQRKQVFYF